MDQIYYGFIQSNHGADHIFIYTKEQILEEFARYGIEPDVLPGNKVVKELDGFPIGGSNSAPSRIWMLYGDVAAKDFICQEADGPDYNDPPLVGLAEYYFALDADEGCMRELLDRFDIDKEAQEKKAMKKVENDTALVCETLGISFNDFYDDKYSYVRMSEVYFLAEIKELLNTAEEKGDLTWGDDTTIKIKLPENMAKKVLHCNGIYKDEEDLSSNCFFVIRKTDDEDLSYDFVEYVNGTVLKNIPCDESEDLMKEVIQNTIESLVGDKEEDKDL